VTGGDISDAYVAKTNDVTFFIKTNNTLLTGLFQKETFGLLTLRKKTALKVPKPIHYDIYGDTLYLVLEYLEKEKETPQTWKILGEGIAALHQQTQPQFGLSYDNFIGSLIQPNSLTETWAEFYAEQRILPLVKKVFDKALFTKEDTEAAETICCKLSSLFPDEPPALLHGDLWSGNVMACSNNEAAIYDPAVYYGHREMDIAMTLLFGGFDSAFYQHYQDIYPLQSGWQQRVALCQLYPLLFHLNLFGSGYYNRVKNVLDNYK